MSWVKVEDKSDGPASWTEYTNHDGDMYKIYDMIPEPATPIYPIYKPGSIEWWDMMEFWIGFQPPSGHWKGIAEKINKIVNKDEVES